ncbi:hypothetical protein NCZ17_03985 [Acinetobacter modestus]|uniref:hypothetical protein n=1 Tax=Acinetobacter modestus TaxID=1776740 RepID=UPI00202EAB6D|nr:hypothetical protein [Acinetobacter modestus]MCM1958526.1 hypothetical protein [Acinetobacter modestus]
MKNKILTTALYSSLFLLTACGGGSENSSSGNSIQSKEKIDYTKTESIQSIYEPIINLSQEQNNIILTKTKYAENIYYGINSGNNFRCSEGSYTKNSDKSITFNKCEFLDFNNDGSSITSLRVMTLSGSINSKKILSTNSVSYDTTLKNFTITPSNKPSVTYNGNIVSQHGSTDSQYQIKEIVLNVVNNETKKTQQLMISNYQLNVNNLILTALGKIQSNPENKFFSVNFKSDLKFENDTDKAAFHPKSAEIIIEDTNNIRNSIKISNASNYQALISAYADGNTVTDYPKVLEWNKLN